RVSNLDYPLPTTLNYEYGAASSTDDRISRITGAQIAGGQRPFLYRFGGLGIVAEVDYEAPDVQLCRTFDSDGKRSMQGHDSQDPGIYPGWDRFGRVKLQAWMDGGVGPGDPGPGKPPILEQKYIYSRVSNRVSSTDLRPGARIPYRDFE